MLPARVNSRLILSLRFGVFALLAACAEMQPQPGTQEQAFPAGGAVPTGEVRFEAWSVTTQSLGNSGTQVAAPAAVIKLASQADMHISKSEWLAANDTLERVLRIAPDYAPGWSRMAWIALQTGDTERARQMATRSNSVGSGRVDLKILNWKFIREASERLGDKAAVQRADRNINALENL